MCVLHSVRSHWEQISAAPFPSSPQTDRSRKRPQGLDDPMHQSLIKPACGSCSIAAPMAGVIQTRKSPLSMYKYALFSLLLLQIAHNNACTLVYWPDRGSDPGSTMQKRPAAFD